MTQAHLRHAEGRPRPSRARGDGAEDPRARRAGRRARRARRPRRRRDAAGQLPRRAPSAPAARRGAARASSARSRASSGRGRSLSSRTCARSTRCSRRRSCGRCACRSCSGTRTGRGRARWGRRSARRRRSISVDRRSFPLASQKVVPIGHGIDLDEFPCADRSNGTRRLPPRVLGRYSRAKGLETILRGVKLALDAGVDARLEVYGPALNAVEREHRAELDALVDELDLERRVRLGHAVLAGGGARACFARARALVNNMQAGAPDKVVYEAAATCLPVLASNPVFDELAAGSTRSCVRARRSVRASRSGSRRSPRCAPDDRPASAGAARARRRQPLGRALGRRRARGRAPMSAGVLHLQKVAGISGSEAHLLSLLPRLRERGWDVRMLMLHENEPGAWDFARALRDARRAARRDPALARRRPDRVRRARPLPRARAAGDPAHAPRARGRVRAARRARSRACRSASRRSTASTSSARAGLRASPTAPSRASRTCTSRSRAGSRATSRRRGLRRARASRSSTTGSRHATGPAPYAGAVPRLLCVGRLIPIKGHIVLLRAFAEARKQVPGLRLDIAGRGPLEPALTRARARSSDRRRGPVPRPRLADPGGDRALGGRRRAVDGRGLRHGRARGDGALAAGDRGGDRRSRRARRRRRDRACSSAGRRRAARAGDRRARGRPRPRREMGRVGRDRALSEFLESRCTERTEALYEGALGSNGRV